MARSDPVAEEQLGALALDDERIERRRICTSSKAPPSEISSASGRAMLLLAGAFEPTGTVPCADSCLDNRRIEGLPALEMQIESGYEPCERAPSSR